MYGTKDVHIEHDEEQSKPVFLKVTRSATESLSSEKGAKKAKI